MKLVINSVSPQQVRETQEAYIIEDVPFVRPMRLSGGYVPENSIKRTANKWDGKPATLNHPRNGRGEPVAAERKPETHLGTIENPQFDGEYVRGDIRINKADLENAGDEAKDIRRKLENGEQIDVSSQYAAQELDPGEYDGEYRENVERIVRPDSVAILPNKPGVCSVEDGCGINPQMVANAEVSLTVRANQEFEVGDLVRWQTQASPGTGRVAEVVTEPGEQVQSTADVDNPPTREASEDEPVYLLDDWDGEEFVSGQVVKSESEMIGMWDDPPDKVMEANNMHEAGVPEEFVFDNPGEAMSKAQEMGLEEIHTHGEGEDTVFMPGETHDELVSELEEMGEMEANQTDLEVTSVSPGDIDNFTDREWDGAEVTAAMPNPSEDEDAASVLDEAHVFHPTSEDARDEKANWLFPFRAGPDEPVNTRALVAIKGSRGVEGTDRITDDQKQAAEEWANQLLENAPDDMFGAMDTEGSSAHMEENTLKEVGKKVLQSLGVTTETQNSTETIGAESPVDSTESAGDSDSNVNRKQLKAEIVENSALTEESLAERCNDGLKAIHNDVMANTEPMEENEDAIVFESREDFENTVEEIVANRLENSEKEDLAAEIVSNSAEYEETESVLDDYPTKKALKDKKELVTDSGSALPGTGMTPNAGSDNTDEFPDMEIGGEL